jgi:hypothetical protein
MIKSTEHHLWRMDAEATAAAVINQEEYDSITNSFGANDFIIEFLKNNGLWETLINPKADLKKNNGNNPRILNGIMAIKELVGIKRISNTGVLFSDVCLMAELGFNLEEVISLNKKDKGVICKNTLWNHSNRIATEESYKRFYGHVKHLRKMKWLRGGVYAVDGYEVEITVNNENCEYEDAGRVWCDKENRWKYGYKLLFLANIADGRERIIGVYLDRIETNEIKIFKKMVTHIEKYVCPLGDMVKLLLRYRKINCV